MNLEALYEEASRRADERFGEILVRILTADLPELIPDLTNPCRKCTVLLHQYVRSKLALHRYGRRDGFWSGRLVEWTNDVRSKGGVWLLEDHVKTARAEFHSASCECGQFLWKGRRWHENQRKLKFQTTLT